MQSTTEILDNILVDIKKALDVESTAVTTLDPTTTETLENVLLDVKKALDVEPAAVTTRELSTKEILENVLLDIKRALDIESEAVAGKELPKTEMLQNILVDIKKAGYVESAALATRDGLLMASNFPSRSEAEIFAATSATMLGAAESATTEFGKGVPNRVIVEFKGAKMIVIGSGPKALLTVSIRSDAKLGSILIKLENSASRIREILK
jgi:predicted regulator of Ras-like GTPase activity (Roadblock/LC7/MglB family)